jgi:hypothetical protein
MARERVGVKWRAWSCSVHNAPENNNLVAHSVPVTIAGNLTRDPEIRFTPWGQPTATFAGAVNRTG